MVEALEDQAKAIDTQWILLNAMFVMFMQVGFCLLEAGSARVQNTTSVILKNSGDFLFVSIMYYIFGYALAYGESTHGFAGTNNFFIEDKNWAYWFFQCAFANTAATSNDILSTLIYLWMKS